MVSKQKTEGTDLIEIVRETSTSICNAEILIRWIKGLPDSVNGVCSKRSDTLYWILINADKSKEQQDETLQHELLHIERHDFDSEKPVKTIESEIHQQIEAWKRLKQKGA